MLAEFGEAGLAADSVKAIRGLELRLTEVV
jgi:hypothetical protein